MKNQARATSALLYLMEDEYRFAMAIKRLNLIVASKVILLLARGTKPLAKHLTEEETEYAIIAAENCGLDFKEM